MIIEYEEVYEDCYQKMVALFDGRDFTEKEALKEIKAQFYGGFCMAIKLSEQTGGTHIYMRMKLDSGRIEEIDVFLHNDGTHYRTSADYCPENHPVGLREEIINTFNELY